MSCGNLWCGVRTVCGCVCQDQEAEAIKKDSGLVVVCGYGRIGKVPAFVPVCDVVCSLLLGVF